MTDRKVIAEIGSCNGDLSLAIETAQAAVEAGAWKVKGQMFRAETLVTRTAPTYGRGLDEPDTQWEAFEKSLTFGEWVTVADAVGWDRFFASVFDPRVVDGYPFDHIKIASADITYRGLIEAVAANAAHPILSTGGAHVEEINTALGWFAPRTPTLLICTLCYPTEPEDANVRRVLTLKQTYRSVGYSDHTRGVGAAMLAFEYGADMVEKHFTIRPGEGGDSDFAIGPDQLRNLAMYDGMAVSETVRETYAGSGRVGFYDCEADARQLARRSVHAAVDIPAGSVITRDMLKVVRPCPPGALAPSVLSQAAGRQTNPESPVGKLARNDIPADTVLTVSMFGGSRFSLTVE